MAKSLCSFVDVNEKVSSLEFSSLEFFIAFLVTKPKYENFDDSDSSHEGCVSSFDAFSKKHYDVIIKRKWILLLMSNGLWCLAVMLSPMVCLYVCVFRSCKGPNEVANVLRHSPCYVIIPFRRISHANCLRCLVRSLESQRTHYAADNR